MRASILAILILGGIVLNIKAQFSYNEKGQAIPPASQPFGKEAFESTGHTVIRWLGNAGFLINSRGTCLMVDPMLKGFDMPLLINMPIAPKDVPHLDAVLITHCDNDHYSVPTCTEMSSVCREYHSTFYVDSLMETQGLNSFGHRIGETFNVGPISIKLTPAYHTWQNEYPGYTHEFKVEDYCGFFMKTPDGLIWAPGDSRFLPEFLELPAPDVIFFDFSDDSWHIGLEGAIKIANAYPKAQLLLSHWGTVDAPDMKPFNADPKMLEGRIRNPERVHVLAPGEAFDLVALSSSEGEQCAETLIFPADAKASSEYNTGDVYVSLLKESGNTMIAHFIFKPYSRNFWHYHPDAEQTLLVLDGEGYYQEEGGEKRVIRKGDVIVTPPNVRHWNGATPGSSIVCMTVTEHAIENHAVQLRAVTDKEYAN